MLKDNPDLKGVIITVPTIFHYEVARFFLLSGVDVFVEKPITTKSSDVQELIKISKKKKLLLVPGHIFLFKREFKIIKSLFNLNGKNTLVSIKRINNGPAILDEGVVFDLGVHDIYLMLNLFNDKPKSVFATALRKNNALIGVSFILKYKKGIVNVVNSWTGLKSTREIHIINGKREFLWQDTEPEYLIIQETENETYRTFRKKRVKFADKFKKEEIYKDFKENALLEEDKAFLNSIITRKSVVNSQEGYYTIKIIEKILESINKRKEVSL